MSNFSSRLCAVVVPLLALAVGCDGDAVDGFSAEEWAQIQQLGPLPREPPADPSNLYADDPAAAALGQRLFFEKAMANALKFGDSGLGNVGDKGKVACASCHDPRAYFIDTRSRPNATSLGVAWTPRNSPSLVNAAYYRWHGWTGREDTLWYQGSTALEGAPSFASSRLDVAHVVFRKYRADYDAVFPEPLDPALDPAAADAARFPASGKPKASAMAADGPWEAMAAADRDAVNRIFTNTGKAIEAYERRLVSRDAPIDAYIAGDLEAISPAAKRGLALFLGKAACVDCHSGPMLSDGLFYNTGVAQTGLPRADEGRFDDIAKLVASPLNSAGAYSDDPAFGLAMLDGLAPTEPVRGAFRTASLRHIAQTAPYMHNGSLATLDDVVEFYDRGDAAGFSGVKAVEMSPLGLTADEKTDLVAFLRTLTGAPVAAELMVDTAIAD